jgi:nucleolar protein 6
MSSDNESIASSASADASTSNDGPRKNLVAVSKDAKKKFILFVGNLAFTTKREAIEEHFRTAVGERGSILVRMLTDKKSGRSRGCCFIEFSSRPALEKGLALHHSTLEGREINVELSAGGGGKGEKRKDKLKKRNDSLRKQRQKLYTKIQKKREHHDE